MRIFDIRKLLIIVIALLSGPILLAQKLSPTQAQSMEARLVASLMSQYHYEKIPINDDLSLVIFDQYLKTLDANKQYFLKEDIEEFDRYKERLDDHIKLGYLLPPFEIFNVYRDRFSSRMDKILSMEELNFNYEEDEYIETDPDKIEWAETEEELDDRWRKVLKSQALDMKLDGRADTAIIRILQERYTRINDAVEDYEGRDIFQLYMNTFAESFDPHSSYFSPITSENFKIRMSQSIEGIGATLTTQNGYTRVASVVPGGPAFESQLINTDDKIVAVGQGVEGDFVDVIDWRLDDVVQLIRGPKGTLVRLKIIPAGKPVATTVPTIIEIVRDKVKLENQVPEGEIQNIDRNGTNYTLGIITVPSFYLDYESLQKGEDYGSTTKDVKSLIDSLQDQDIDGLVIDLRSNGGGSLKEAIELTGLFIDKGPVVQIKNSDGSIEKGEDEENGLYYEGPLAVLTNRFSASASEIFSAAIQDYNRGIVVGENTFGKGTVQNLISLNQFVPKEEEKLGQVKLTLSKFYRVTGSSTQHKGVKPDIGLPSPFQAKNFGESSYERALEWDKIKATDYSASNFIDNDLRKKLAKNYQQRLEQTDYLQNLQADVNEVLSNQENSKLSLNLEVRKKEMEEALARRNAAKKLNAGVQSSSELKKSGNSDSKIKDPYLREGIVVLTDLISLGV